MHGFADKLRELMVRAGVPSTDIHSRKKRHITIPGFYRPTKQWDVVVLSEGKLPAAIELKAQVGSFSNNVNNRAEEALGNATDFWAAYRGGAFSLSPQPWLGYLFLLQDHPAVHPRVRVEESNFRVLPEFVDSSYMRRYELLCEKLVRERQYTAACFLMSDSANMEHMENYSEPVPELSAGAFITALLRHVTPV